VTYYIFKIVITTLLVVVISEIAKRSSFMGALLASIPLISVLSMLWLYVETKDVAKVSALSTSIFWLVIPSLSLFVSLPLLLKQGINVYVSFAISLGVTIACYYLVIGIAKHLDLSL
jgi:hypothetical protein